MATAVVYTLGMQIRLGVWSWRKEGRGEEMLVYIHVFKLAYKILNIIIAF